MGAAIGWGALAASSLVIGALLGLARPWPKQLVGLVLGFGAGALISAVSFELFGEGVRLAGALIVMLVDSMIPEATEQSGRTTGLVTTLGFAVAAALSFNT